MNLFSQSIIIFLSTFLLELTNSQVSEETVVFTGNGGELRLEGFSAHHTFATALEEHLQAKIRSAAQSAVTKSKVKPGILLSKINSQQYTFIQVLHALFLGDVDFSNILIRIFSQLSTEVKFLQNDDFLNSIAFTSDYMYKVIKVLAEHKINGLTEVPNFISDNILKLIDKTHVLKRASLEGNRYVIEWLFKMNFPATFEAINVASYANHWDVVKLLLRGLDLSDEIATNHISRVTNEKNETLVHFAAELSLPDVLKALIEAGGDVDARSANGDTPFHRALASNCLPCIEILLEKGAKSSLGSLFNLSILKKNFLAFQMIEKAIGSVEWESNYGISPLYLSKRLIIISLLKSLITSNSLRINDLKNLGIRESLLFETILLQDNCKNLSDSEVREKNNIQYLIDIYHTLEAESDFHDSADDFGVDSLVKAVSKFGNKEHGKILIDLGFSESKIGDLFLLAVKNNNTDMINCLLESGVVVTNQDENGYTSLHFATKWRDVDLVKRLLNTNPNTSIEDVNGNNAVFLAIQYGFKDILDLYFKNGFNVNYRNSCGKTSLFVAVEHGQTDIVKFILDKGASVNDKYSLNITVLYLAVTKGYLQITNLLLKKGADINHDVSSGYTALHFAADKGLTDIVKLLIENGADMKSKFGDGWIPLHLATFACHYPVIEVMLESSKDIVHLANDKGLQSIHIAAIKGSPKILNYLLDNGANINIKDSAGETPLFKAAKLGHDKAVCLLINRGANKAFCSRLGHSPLHIAALHGHLKVIDILIKNGADVNSMDIFENRPLFEAVLYNHVDVLTTLIKYGANANFLGKLDQVPVTPLHLANLLNYTKVSNILKAYGAKELVEGYNGPIIQEIKIVSGQRRYIFNWKLECLQKWFSSQKNVVTLSC